MTNWIHSSASRTQTIYSSLGWCTYVSVLRYPAGTLRPAARNISHLVQFLEYRFRSPVLLEYACVFDDILEPIECGRVCRAQIAFSGAFPLITFTWISFFPSLKKLIKVIFLYFCIMSAAPLPTSFRSYIWYYIFPSGIVVHYSLSFFSTAIQPTYMPDAFYAIS